MRDRSSLKETKVLVKLVQVTSIKCGFQTTDGAPEQFVLRRFDTAPFCCVTKTSNFEKLMVHMLHRKIRMNDGLGVSKMVTSTRDKKED